MRRPASGRLVVVTLQAYTSLLLIRLQSCLLLLQGPVSVAWIMVLAARAVCVLATCVLMTLSILIVLIYILMHFAGRDTMILILPFGCGC